MPDAVVVGGVVQCPHSGQVALKSGSSKLTVAGADAVVAGMEAPGLPFTPSPAPPDNPAPCSFMTGTNPAPCLGLAPATVGASTKLTVGGMGVLLSTATGLTTGPGAGPWTIQSAGQSKLTVSS